MQTGGPHAKRSNAIEAEPEYKDGLVTEATKDEVRISERRERVSACHTC